MKKAGIEWDLDSMCLADADILDGKTIVALLAGAVQAEKFCSGACLDLLERGCIVRWLERLKRLDERPRIKYHPGLFDEFRKQKILDRWNYFPNTMWGLGYEQIGRASCRERV